MNLDKLTVLHMPKHAASAGSMTALPEGFILESCLRWVGIYPDWPWQDGRVTEILPQAMQVFRGIDAYRFLLEVACGLHSKIQGESEIFGQLKQAWKSYQADQTEASRPLQRLMQTLVADVKRIRTEYLHGIGGDAYHSAIRKLLHLRKDQSLLIIGAGQFGAMLAEKLRHKVETLTVLNRSPHPLVAQAGWDNLEAAIDAATHVLVAIPAGKDEALDARIQAAWQQKRHGKLVHLAQMDYAGSNWENLPHFLTLADVMHEQNLHSVTRPQAIAQAVTAIRLMAESRAVAPRKMPKLPLFSEAA